MTRRQPVDSRQCRPKLPAFLEQCFGSDRLSGFERMYACTHAHRGVHSMCTRVIRTRYGCMSAEHN